MSRVKKDKLGKTKSYNGVDISDTTSFFSRKKLNKTRKNTGVLKLSRTVQKVRRRQRIEIGVKVKTVMEPAIIPI